MSTPRETYSHGHHDSVLRSHRWRTAENSAAYLLPRLRPDMRLLDVGTGPGTVTVGLARRLHAGSVVGVDNVASAVAATLAQAEADGVGIGAAVADVYTLPFGDDSFDVVHAHQLLQHLADPAGALTEMRRVCRPGGLVAVRDADYAAMTWYPESTALSRWLELYQALARANRGEPDAGRRLRSWARESGFVEVTSTGSVWCFAADDDLGWWTTTWAERLTGSAFGAQAVALGLTEPAELALLARGWRAFGREPAAWFSVLHGEVVAIA